MTGSQRMTLFIIFHSLLPVVGWVAGGGLLTKFLTTPFYVVFLVATFTGGILAPVTMKKFSNITSKGTLHQKTQDAMIAPAFLLGITLSIFSPLSDAAQFTHIPGGEIVRWLGILLLCLGMLLMVLGPLHLGKQFSMHVTLQKDHQLVTSGIYTLWRHPRYAGCIYWAIGTALTFLSWGGLAVSLAYTGLFIWRMLNEETFLAEHFAETWYTYAAKTKRIIPFIF